MNKQYKITTIGTPNIEKMSKTEQKSFFGSLLALMTEYYHPKKKDNALPSCAENANADDSGKMKVTHDG